MLRFSFLFVLTLCDYAKFITDDKYAAFITENPTTIVAFYTPPNNKLMKEYENAAKKLLAIPIRIAMVDCTKEKKTCQKENIKAYPTLKIFKNGISQDYKGDHTSLAIVDTMSTVAKTEQDILDENKSDLVEVTDLAYSQFIKDNKISLIMFHAPWCGHCQNLKPHFELAASELLSQDIILATVDCTTEKHICSKHDIKGYPTLKYFKNRVVSDYVGGRSTEEIVQVMSNGNKLIVEENPDIFTLTSANHEQFLKDNKVTLLKFYAPWW
jgi:protein disulfide-isomerase-like protein